ncbi:MAG: choice-of-anchor S family protein, partial [Candidatus Heimdallarchaeota archaeon]
QFCAAATFGVSVGDTFTYDCVASEQTIVWGSNSSIAEGYNLDEHHFAVGTSFSVEILDISTSISTIVTFSVSNDGYQEGYMSNARMLLLSTYFEYSSLILMMKAYMGSHEWDMPIDLAFIETDASTWSDLIDIVDYMNELYLTLMPTSDITMDARYTDDGTTFTYEMLVSGVLNNTYTPLTSPAIPWTDYSDNYEYYCMFAYDKATGVMLGTHLLGSISGVSNVTDYAVTADFHIEKAGYDLPTELLSTNTEEFFGYSIAIAFGSITTLVMIAVYVRRKKSSHLNH